MGGGGGGVGGGVIIICFKIFACLNFTQCPWNSFLIMGFFIIITSIHIIIIITTIVMVITFLYIQSIELST